MTSKVAPALQNEKISVRLSDLDVDAAIRKSFQGQPWNYYITLGKGITVIDRATAVALPGSVAARAAKVIAPLDGDNLCLVILIAAVK